MGVIATLKHWYKFKIGIGKTMRQNGAEPRPCPHCDKETPVYRSNYDSNGNPISFSVCLWCDGIIEFSGATTYPHEPYASAKELQTHLKRSKQ